MNCQQTCASCKHRPPSPDGKDIVGREIHIRYTDGGWYTAVVVTYDEKSDEHKIVYVNDDALELLRLRDQDWFLVPQRPRSYDNKVLRGAVIEFTYPDDGLQHRAMVYDHSTRGDRIKVAYLNEYKSDNLYGGGWEYITSSPCVLQQDYEHGNNP